MRRFRSRLMFFPILDYDDGYGWTYGAQTAVVNAFGKGTRLAVPLSWGGDQASDRRGRPHVQDRAADAADRDVRRRSQRENPHFLTRRPADRG